MWRLKDICGDPLRRKLLLSKLKRLKTLEKDPWWGGCGRGGAVQRSLVV